MFKRCGKIFVVPFFITVEDFQTTEPKNITCRDFILGSTQCNGKISLVIDFAIFTQFEKLVQRLERVFEQNISRNIFAQKSLHHIDIGRMPRTVILIQFDQFPVQSQKRRCQCRVTLSHCGIERLGKVKFFLFDQLQIFFHFLTVGVLQQCAVKGLFIITPKKGQIFIERFHEIVILQVLVRNSDGLVDRKSRDFDSGRRSALGYFRIEKLLAIPVTLHDFQQSPLGEAVHLFCQGDGDFDRLFGALFTIGRSHLHSIDRFTIDGILTGQERDRQPCILVESTLGDIYIRSTHRNIQLSHHRMLSPFDDTIMPERMTSLGTIEPLHDNRGILMEITRKNSIIYTRFFSIHLPLNLFGCETA